MAGEIHGVYCFAHNLICASSVTDTKRVLSYPTYHSSYTQASGP
jgi:hypothetical protein